MPTKSADEAAVDGAEEIGDVLSSVIPSNLSQAEEMASMLAINAAADHLVERAIGRKAAAKAAELAAKAAAKAAAQQAGEAAASQAIGKAAATASKSIAKAAAKQAAVQASAEAAAGAATKAAMGPAGWAMVAVQVGGMLLDIFDPFNIARSYTNHDLQSMHDMMAGAMTATLKGARACIDPQYTQAQSATDTTPEVMCLDDGLCISMYPGQSTLTPPPDAQCFSMPFPGTAKPVMPIYDARVPSVVLDVLSISDGQGALLLHNWLMNQPNADARVFDDRTVDAAYRAFFNQAMNAEWQAAGSPPVPVADVEAPKNVGGESIETTKVMSQTKELAFNPPSTFGDDAKNKVDSDKKDATIKKVGMVALIIGGFLLIRHFMRKRAAAPVYVQYQNPQMPYSPPRFPPPQGLPQYTPPPGLPQYQLPPMPR